MREDGRLTSPQGVSHNINYHTDIEKVSYHMDPRYNIPKMTSQAHSDNGGAVFNGPPRHKYDIKDWDLHIKGPRRVSGPPGSEHFTLNLPDSGIVGRNWSHSYPGYYMPSVQNDDPFTSVGELKKTQVTSQLSQATSRSSQATSQSSPRRSNAVKPLEAGEPDLSPDSNQGNKSTVEQYNKQVNKPYNVLENAHPTDVLGGVINLLYMAERNKMLNESKTHHGRQRTSVTEKEIEKIENKMYKCDDPNYPHPRYSQYFPGQYCTKEDVDFEKSLHNKQFCYIDKTVTPELVDYYKRMRINSCQSQPHSRPQPHRVPSHQHQSQPVIERTINKIKTKINLAEDERKYYNSKIEEDKRKYRSDLNLDRNQVMVDNGKTPININMSCNQGGRGEPDVSPRGGYGTPNLHETCFSPGGCYGKTLNYWYGDQNAGNNVGKRRMWRDSTGGRRSDTGYGNRDHYQYGPANRDWVGQIGRAHV